jgi:hypothetical protein
MTIEGFRVTQNKINFRGSSKRTSENALVVSPTEVELYVINKSKLNK